MLRMATEPKPPGSGASGAVLASLHARHEAALTAYARAIVGHDDGAEEAVQDAFAGMLAHPQRLAGAREARGYLFGAVRLAALAVRRRRRRWWSLALRIQERPWLVPAPGAPEPPGDLEALAREVEALPEERLRPQSRGRAQPGGRVAVLSSDEPSAGLAVGRMAPAPAAVLLELHAVRRVPLRLARLVVASLALRARERDCDSDSGCHFSFSDRVGDAVVAPGGLEPPTSAL